MSSKQLSFHTQVQTPPRSGIRRRPQKNERDTAEALRHVPLNTDVLFMTEAQRVRSYLMTLCLSIGEKVLFTKGAESAILPYATSGEIDKTRVHVDEFALVSFQHHTDIFSYLFTLLSST